MRYPLKRSVGSLKLRLTVIVLVIAATTYLIYTVPKDVKGGSTYVRMPALDASARAGQALFLDKCATCHGDNAGGTETGPPLIHRYYKPDHHADEAFQRAVRLGTRAHHWSFGDMPPVDGLSRDDVAKIITFVRAVQRHNGIR